MEDLRTIIALNCRNEDAPNASEITANVPIYDCNKLADWPTDAGQADTLRRELADVLLNGPGVFVLRSAFADTTPIDAATDVFNTIIEREKTASSGGGDHFAASGANDRIWNSLEKLGREAPDVFVQYHSNPWLELASRAWLGPAFQMTAQVNLVHPGGKAQTGHCDYHLGFMTKNQVSQYPAHVHAVGAQLTLQGAVAHCDMPVESGTTKLLPFSQTWPQNYLRFRDDDVSEVFEDNYVQLPLQKGDALFFSPGLMHAAGENSTSDIHRMANLLQVSSPLGRAMETIRRRELCLCVYRAAVEAGLPHIEQEALLASTAEGYPFPTDLERDPPVDGLAPVTQRDLMRSALRENWPFDKLSAELAAYENRRSPA
ncbi:phytanoyl-CoA dioxygenase family protein [Ahrensia sp. R2A130]|uniref:phytanoyl-CoA dioxygenase family protein n=1 Tax=Ahrensia sp. R2A130 TaxID=744979 RepID=UPI0001E0F05E|nr:phytanoyl-CoA dioxygenase family protein [Ahrensia sp. R2A130]EFL90980.1 phytanoyl-CoA dioxygenase [Ahrensia sp. R2A130]